ncbi:hypothetical protein ACOCLD_02005 [Pseudomonas sp. MAC6]|uniref:hypothetical protein n=1 Tax=Pseudomonas sp. MAC6 TaxID=3401633 RepID=UPI003BF554F0
MNGLTRENSSTIAFIVNCYLSNSISTDELQQWATRIMESTGEYPDYIVELLSFDAPRFHIYKAIGFSPSRRFTNQESEAIFGITYLRNRVAFDGPTKECAINSLHMNQTILTEFRTAFPFIQIAV